MEAFYFFNFLMHSHRGAQLLQLGWRLRRRGRGASLGQLEGNQDRGCLLATAYGVGAARHMSDRMNHLQRAH